VLRGYFIEVIYSGAYVYPENMVSNRRVEWESGSVGAMKNSYPPRLTVREPSGTLETSGTVIALEESQHHLYLHVYDDEGRHTGFNYAKGIIENQIPNSQFYMYERVSLAVIPSNVTNFKVIIDAKYAQYTNESYKLTVMTIENLEVKNQTTTTATILKGAIQQYSIEILPQKIPNIKPYSETPLNWLILCIIGITIIISTTLLYYSRKRKNADK